MTTKNSDDGTTRAQGWLEENRSALDSSNDYVAKHGLPLGRYRDVAPRVWRTRTVLTSADGGDDLAIELELDKEARTVTLCMREFDHDLVVAFVRDEMLHLPQLCGVRVDDSLFEHVNQRDLYQLFVELAGRRHPAQMDYLVDGRVKLRLGDPDAEYLRRCEAAIEQLLREAAALDIEAVVAGVDHFGRPAPDRDGYLLVMHPHMEFSDRRLDKLRDLEQAIEAGHAVCVTFTGYAHRVGDFTSAVAAPHFAWDPSTRRVVRRNWSSDDDACGSN